MLILFYDFNGNTHLFFINLGGKQISRFEKENIAYYRVWEVVGFDKDLFCYFVAYLCIRDDDKSQLLQQIFLSITGWRGLMLLPPAVFLITL
jgi:hypothetical protein